MKRRAIFAELLASAGDAGIGVAFDPSSVAGPSLAAVAAVSPIFLKATAPIRRYVTVTHICESQITTEESLAFLLSSSADAATTAVAALPVATLWSAERMLLFEHIVQILVYLYLSLTNDINVTY